MEALRIRELTPADIEALLAFETLNREWFESHIDPRAPSFYSKQGVAEHIEGYLADHAEGVWHGFVLQDAGGHIIGRANLKSIDAASGTAEVGYRIAEQACGQGLATQALRFLIDYAKQRLGLVQLLAYAFDSNVGSQKVLTRCGFVADQATDDEAETGTTRFVLALVRESA